MLRIAPWSVTDVTFEECNGGTYGWLRALSITLSITLPRPIGGAGTEEAVDAQRPDVESPFPHCFVCGYARAQDDGLHIHAGPVRDGVVAGVWVPREDTVGEEFVWAALDCPGAYAAGIFGRGALVLGRLAADVRRVPVAGEHCVVLGWSLGAEGRKHYAGTAVFAGDELVGAAT